MPTWSFIVMGCAAALAVLLVAGWAVLKVCAPPPRRAARSCPDAPPFAAAPCATPPRPPAPLPGMIAAVHAKTGQKHSLRRRLSRAGEEDAGGAGGRALGPRACAGARRPTRPPHAGTPRGHTTRGRFVPHAMRTILPLSCAHGGASFLAPRGGTGRPMIGAVAPRSPCVAVRRCAAAQMTVTQGYMAPDPAKESSSDVELGGARADGSRV
eukprot:2416748-Prymnesium_polylepis.1